MTGAFNSYLLPHNFQYLTAWKNQSELALVVNICTPAF